MNLEKQVTSLEISKRLKELGCVQKSYFYWAAMPELFPKSPWMLRDCHDDGTFHKETISAFTSAELGAMIPAYFHYKGVMLEYSSYMTDEEWSCDENDQPKHLLQSKYYWCGYLRMQPKFSDTNEANARGLMLIHLLENGMIKL